MQTLTEITQAETARRLRARDFEVAQERVENLQRKVDRLSVEPSADAATRLRTIIEAAQGLPEDVIGSVGGLLPVSGVAGAFIVGMASSALAGVERTDERRCADLSSAQAELKRAEAHLATFTE